jgi:hypothetical protein
MKERERVQDLCKICFGSPLPLQKDTTKRGTVALLQVYYRGVQVLKISMEWSGDGLIENREMEGFGIDADAWYGWIPFLLSNGRQDNLLNGHSGSTMSLS